MTASIPASDGDAGTAAPSRVSVHAYSAVLRGVTIALSVVAALNVANLAAHVAADVFMGTRSAPPFALAMTLAVFSGAPLLAVAALHRFVAATVDVQAGVVVVTTRRARIEIPAASIDAVRPLRLPVPGPGVAFAMTSGRRFRYRLVVADPEVLVDALARASIAGAAVAHRHATILYASAKRSIGPRRWGWAALKLVVLPLALTIILFRLHQVIGYGGALGQYYLLGLKSYVIAFALAGAGTIGGLWVYAAICRLLGEGFALLATWIAPSGARAIRVVVEGMCLVAYYGLVPAYVAAALLA